MQSFQQCILNWTKWVLILFEYFHDFLKDNTCHVFLWLRATWIVCELFHSYYECDLNKSMYFSDTIIKFIHSSQVKDVTCELDKLLDGTILCNYCLKSLPAQNEVLIFSSLTIHLWNGKHGTIIVTSLSESWFSCSKSLNYQTNSSEKMRTS